MCAKSAPVSDAAMSDVLVSNAGICPFAEFLTMPHAVWEKTRQVNLDGTFYVTQGKAYYGTLLSSVLSILYSAVAKQMQQQTPQGGSIIGISSISALVGGGLQWYVISISLASWRIERFIRLVTTPRRKRESYRSCRVALWLWESIIFARTQFFPGL